MSFELDGADHNKTAFDRVAKEYGQKHLHPPERAFLETWRSRWHEVDMLDLGVGAGRTAYTFAAITRRYVGVDYSPKMIGICRDRYVESEMVKFIVGNASDLSFLGDDKFDFILFSFNGIDYVGHDTRKQMLRQIRARLKGVQSYFLFSSHSLHSYPFALRWSGFELKHLIRTFYRLFKDAVFNARRAFHNRGVGVEEAKRRGWAILNDGAHEFRLSTYYVTPDEQVRQLEDIDLELVEVMNSAGERVDWRLPQPDDWLYYLCRIAGKSRTQPR